MPEITAPPPQFLQAVHEAINFSRHRAEPPELELGRAAFKRTPFSKLLPIHVLFIVRHKEA